MFVSHILEDVMALCDEVTVLRDGHVELSAEPRDRADGAADRRRDARATREVAAAAPDATLKEAVAESVGDDAGGRLELRGAAVEGALEPLEPGGARRARSSGSRAWPGPAITRCSSW